MPNRRIFVYDLDDTLFANYHFFVKAESAFYDAVLGERRTSEQTLPLLTLYKKINSDNIPRFGYSPRRIAVSMQEAYQQWQRLQGRQTHPVLEKKVFDLGLGVATREKIIAQGLYPGVSEVLAIHRERKDYIAIVTKGHEPTQTMKIDALGLGPYFNEIHIVPDSKRTIFAMYAFHKAPKYVIGNSVKSDILPALEFGFEGVHVDTDTWEHEKIPEEHIPKHIRRVKDIREYVHVLRSLEPAGHL